MAALAGLFAAQAVVPQYFTMTLCCECSWSGRGLPTRAERCTRCCMLHLLALAYSYTAACRSLLTCSRCTKHCNQCIAGRHADLAEVP